MKNIAHTMITSLFLIITLLLNTNITAMKRAERPTEDVTLPTIQQPKREFGMEPVWIRTADGQLAEVPKWQIDQMKVLQLLFAHQKGTNSRSNPIDVSTIKISKETDQMLDETTLKLLKNALISASVGIKNFKEFYSQLTRKQQIDLMNAAAVLEATNITALLLEPELLEEIQKKIISTSGIVDKFLNYLETNFANYNNYRKEHQHAVTCSAFSSNGINLLLGLNNGSLLSQNVKTHKVSYLLKNYPSKFTCAAFGQLDQHMNATYTAAGSNTGSIFLKNYLTREVIWFLGKFFGSVQCITFHPSNNFLLAGYSNGNLGWWDIKNKKGRIVGNHPGVSCLAFSSNGNLLASGSTDGSLIIWSPQTGKKIQTIHGHKAAITCITFSHDNYSVLSGSEDHNLILSGTYSGNQLHILQGHQAPITYAAYNTNDTQIVSAATNNTIITWDAHTGDRIKVESKQTPGVQTVIKFVDFLPNGNISWSRVSPTFFEWNFPGTELLTLPQIRFLYRLYVAKMNNKPVVIDPKDPDYVIYQSFTDEMKKLISEALPFATHQEVKMEEIKAKIIFISDKINHIDSIITKLENEEYDTKNPAKKNVLQKQIIQLETKREQKQRQLKKLIEIQLFGNNVMNIDEKINIINHARNTETFYKDAEENIYYTLDIIEDDLKKEKRAQEQ